MNYSTMNNKDLYKYCRRLGKLSLKYKNKFIGTLPEVYNRKLYRQYKMGSIYEFAAKLSGVTSEVVDKVLYLNIKLKNKPLLREQLLSGSVGWSKLDVIASIATPETDKLWASRIQTMSKSTLAVLKRDLNPTPQKLKTFQKFTINLSPENIQQLQILKEQFKTVTWNDTFTELVNQINKKSLPKQNKTQKVSRYIPQQLRKQALSQTQQLCANPGCSKPAQVLHHQQPFSISKSHESIIPLCKSHHDIIHHTEGSFINQKYLEHKKLVMVADP